MSLWMWLPNRLRLRLLLLLLGSRVSTRRRRSPVAAPLFRFLFLSIGFEKSDIL